MAKIHIAFRILEFSVVRSIFYILKHRRFKTTVLLETKEILRSEIKTFLTSFKFSRKTEHLY
jgi:hypothetical protein